MSIEKRKRDINFSVAEKIFLVELVEARFQNLENKKSDAVSVKEKMEAWKALAEEFNSQNLNVLRNWTSLKSSWENLKKTTKKMITHDNASRIATGGGPPVVKHVRPEEKPLFDKVRALILPVAVGFCNTYDTDIAVSSAVHMDNNEASSGDEFNQQNEESINGDWSTYSSANLRTPRTRILRDFPSTYNRMDPGDCMDAPPENIQMEKENPTEPLNSATVAPEETPRSSKNGGSRHSKSTSRRRPVISSTSNDELVAEKIKALKTASVYAAEEHELIMKINTEKLKQEKLRTKILEEKLKKIHRGLSPSSESDSFP